MDDANKVAEIHQDGDSLVISKLKSLIVECNNLTSGGIKQDYSHIYRKVKPFADALSISFTVEGIETTENRYITEHFEKWKSRPIRSFKAHIGAYLAWLCCHHPEKAKELYDLANIPFRPYEGTPPTDSEQEIPYNIDRKINVLRIKTNPLYKDFLDFVKKDGLYKNFRLISVISILIFLSATISILYYINHNSESFEKYSIDAKSERNQIADIVASVLGSNRQDIEEITNIVSSVKEKYPEKDTNDIISVIAKKYSDLIDFVDGVDTKNVTKKLIRVLSDSTDDVKRGDFLSAKEKINNFINESNVKKNELEEDQIFAYEQLAYISSISLDFKEASKYYTLASELSEGALSDVYKHQAGQSLYFYGVHFSNISALEEAEVIYNQIISKHEELDEHKDIHFTNYVKSDLAKIYPFLSQYKSQDSYLKKAENILRDVVSNCTCGEKEIGCYSSLKTLSKTLQYRGRRTLLHAQGRAEHLARLKDSAVFIKRASQCKYGLNKNQEEDEYLVNLRNFIYRKESGDNVDKLKPLIYSYFGDIPDTIDRKNYDPKFSEYFDFVTRYDSEDLDKLYKSLAIKRYELTNTENDKTYERIVDLCSINHVIHSLWLERREEDLLHEAIGYVNEYDNIYESFPKDVVYLQCRGYYGIFLSEYGKHYSDVQSLYKSLSVFKELSDHTISSISDSLGRIKNVILVIERINKLEHSSCLNNAGKSFIEYTDILFSLMDILESMNEIKFEKEWGKFDKIRRIMLENYKRISLYYDTCVKDPHNTTQLPLELLPSGL